MKRIWHALISGHRWEVKAQTANKPSNALLKHAAETYYPDEREKKKLIEKYYYGWSEALLICSCGKFTKIEMVGNGKT